MIAIRIIIVFGLLALAVPRNDRFVCGQDAPGDSASRVAKRPCLVCGGAYREGMDVVQYKGRPVYLCSGLCRQAWDANPDQFFVKRQSQSALFGEEQVVSGQVHYGWFYFGLYVLAGLVCGAFCSYMAVSRGLAASGWLMGGLLFNVLAVLILAAFVKTPVLRDIPRGARKIPATANPIRCPECNGENHPSADHCVHCSHTLTPTTKAETNVIKSR